MSDPTLNMPEESCSTLSLDGGYNVVGYGQTSFTTSNTRYIGVGPEKLRELAELIEDAAGSCRVVVGVTPERPLVVKNEKDDPCGFILAPRLKKEAADD